MKKMFNLKVNSKLLKYNLKSNRVYLILFTISMFVAFPLTVIIANTNRSGSVVDSAIFALLVIAMLIVLITPFIVFGYLNQKKSVDVYHALPIKRKELLFTEILSSLLIVFIPFTFNFILGYGLNALFGYSVEMQTLFNYFIYIILLIAIHAIPVFVIMNTGTMADGAIHTIILLALPAVIYGAFSGFASTYLFGVKQISPDILKKLTPVYALFTIANNDIIQENLWVSGYWVVAIVLMTLFTSRLYFKRKSEKSEEPFVNDKYFPIVATSFVPLLFVLLNIAFSDWSIEGKMSRYFTLESIVVPLALTFIIYIILSIFRYRSTKYFVKSSLQYLVIMTITVAVSLTLISTNAFNLIWRTPNAKDVKKIVLNDSQLYNLNPIFNHQASLYDAHGLNVELTDKETIEEFIDVHDMINNRLRKQKKYISKGDETNLYNSPLACKNDYPQFISFTYILENGKSVDKEFKIPIELILEFTELLNQKDYQIVMNPFLNDEIQPKNINVFNNIMSEKQNVTDENFRETLMKHYFKDLDNLTAKDMAYKPSKLKYILEYELVDVSKNDSPKIYENGVDFARLYKINGYQQEKMYTMLIDDRFPNTVAYLDSLENTKIESVHSYELITRVPTKMGNMSKAYCGIISSGYGHYYEQEIFSMNADYDPREIVDYIEGSYIRPASNNILVIDNALELPINPVWKP